MLGKKRINLFKLLKNIHILILIFILAPLLANVSSCFGEEVFESPELEQQKFYKIIIDPGHGGNDKGVISLKSGLLEKDLTLDVAHKLQHLLLKNTSFQAVLTRTTDENVSLCERAALANNHKASLFLSIHFNAHFSDGLEEFQLFVASYSGEELERFAINKWKNWKAAQYRYLTDSKDLALSIEKVALGSRMWKSFNLFEMPISVLRSVSMPAVLVEVDFASSQEKFEKFKSEEYKQKVAEILFQGIISFLKQQGLT